jgi:hypothetical protein
VTVLLADVVEADHGTENGGRGFAAVSIRYQRPVEACLAQAAIAFLSEAGPRVKAEAIAKAYADTIDGLTTLFRS